MYTRLIQILLLILVGTILFEGLPGLSASIKSAMPGHGHTPQYNLVFWIITLIGLFALLKSNRKGNNP